PSAHFYSFRVFAPAKVAGPPAPGPPADQTGVRRTRLRSQRLTICGALRKLRLRSRRFGKWKHSRLCFPRLDILERRLRRLISRVSLNLVHVVPPLIHVFAKIVRHALLP